MGEPGGGGQGIRLTKAGVVSGAQPPPRRSRRRHRAHTYAGADKGGRNGAGRWRTGDNNFTGVPFGSEIVPIRRHRSLAGVVTNHVRARGGERRTPRFPGDTACRAWFRNEKYQIITISFLFAEITGKQKNFFFFPPPRKEIGITAAITRATCYEWYRERSFPVFFRPPTEENTPSRG